MDKQIKNDLTLIAEWAMIGAAQSTGPTKAKEACKRATENVSDYIRDNTQALALKDKQLMEYENMKEKTPDFSGIYGDEQIDPCQNIDVARALVKEYRHKALLQLKAAGEYTSKLDMYERHVYSAERFMRLADALERLANQMSTGDGGAGKDRVFLYQIMHNEQNNRP